MNWDAAKRVVVARDGHCLRCLGEPQVVHHRRVRGMGGSGDPAVNTGLANLICLCDFCHRHVHLNPAESYQTGFLLRMGEDPEAIPLAVRAGFTVRLDATGNIAMEVCALF